MKIWNSLLAHPRAARFVLVALVAAVVMMGLPHPAQAQDTYDWCGMDGCYTHNVELLSQPDATGSVLGLLYVLGMNAIILACLVYELGCFSGWVMW